MFYSWQRSQSRNQGPALLDVMFAELGCCGLGVPGRPPGPPGHAQNSRSILQGWHCKPLSSWLRDQPDTRHILWAGSCLGETLQDISALSWFYPSRKCRQCYPSVPFLNQWGAGLGLQEGGCPMACPTPHCTRAGTHTHTLTRSHIHSYTYIHTHTHTLIHVTP